MGSLPRPAARARLSLYAATARRSLRRHGLRPHRAIGALDPAMVFIVGCPRSGTTITAGALGSVPGFFDLGEVNRFKAAIPGLHKAVVEGRQAEVTTELRRILRRAQRVAFASGARAIEQTPEAAYVIPQLAAAFPESRFIHLLRDGRDVVASLLERGWLSPGTSAEVDDAGLALGDHARFWVEAGREAEFERSSEARRCAWAWRRYETAAAGHLAALERSRVEHVRYEDLARDPAIVAARLTTFLGEGPPDAFIRSFARFHSDSVGRHAQNLTAAQLREVHAEAGDLLREHGYTASGDAKPS